MPPRYRILTVALLLMASCAAPGAGSAPAADPSADAAKGEVYEVDEVQVPPRLENADEFTRILARTFPPALRFAGSRGRVTVSFIVAPNGRPRSIQVIRASHDAFVQPTREAVERMRFTPGLLHGRAVNVRIEQPIDWEVGGNPGGG